MDDNSILCYGTRNGTIDGFCPKNVSRDFGETWEVSRSPMPGQGGGRNPVMIKLQSGRLLYVSNIVEAKDPALTGFDGAGVYVCLSEDNLYMFLHLLLHLYSQEHHLPKPYSRSERFHHVQHNAHHQLLHQ